MKSAYNFVPGVMGLILMLICAMMTSISIVREKETGTMEVLLVSPVKPLFIILAKAVPYFVLSFVNLTTILLLSGMIFPIESMPVILQVISAVLPARWYIYSYPQHARMGAMDYAYQSAALFCRGNAYHLSPWRWICRTVSAVGSLVGLCIGLQSVGGKKL